MHTFSQHLSSVKCWSDCWYSLLLLLSVSSKYSSQWFGVVDIIFYVFQKEKKTVFSLFHHLLSDASIVNLLRILETFFRLMALIVNLSLISKLPPSNRKNYLGLNILSINCYFIS